MSDDQRIEQVPLALLDSNPYRPADEYDPEKLRVLKASFEANDVWPSVIARPQGNRYELAFGHHRVKAAEEMQISSIPVIIEDLDDRQMLHYLADENAEEYGGSFDTCFQSWRAAEAYLKQTSPRAEVPQDIEIARELEWFRDKNKSLNDAAFTCAAAGRLIKKVGKNVFQKLSVRAVREITAVVEGECDQREKLVERNAMSRQAADLQQSCYYQAMSEIAEELKPSDSKLRIRDIRTKLRTRAEEKYGAKKAPPDFRRAIDDLVKRIDAFLTEGKTAEQLGDIADSLEYLEGSDKKELQRINLAFGHLEVEIQRWKKVLRLRNPRIIKEDIKELQHVA